MPRLERQPLILFVLGLIFGLLGLADYADGIVEYVVGIVDGIAWSDLWRPVFDPPPMNTYTYRPLTTLSVKVLLAVSGGDTQVMTALHVLCLPWFGLASWRFLRAVGLEAAAFPAAVGVMALPSMLFSAWIPVESDVMGAAFLCEAGAVWPRLMATRARRDVVLYTLWLFGAATTKETSAAAGVVLVVAHALMALRTRQARGLALSWAAGYIATLAIFVTPLLLAKGQAPHDFHIEADGFNWSRAGFFALHNLTQIFYLLSSGGAALIALFAAPGSPRRFGAAALALAAFLLAAPPLRVYNHYESVIIDHVGYVIASVALLSVGLIAALWRRSPALGTPPSEVVGALALPVSAQVLVWLPIGLFAVLAIAPIVALQSRPDVSARLYAPVVPALHGLAWHVMLRLWARRRDHPLLRVTAPLFLFSFALFPVAAGLGTTLAYRARMDAEATAKPVLAELMRRPGMRCPFIIATNRNHELASEELVALGAPWDACSELFVPNKLGLDTSDADLTTWKVQGYAYSLVETGTRNDVRDALIAGKVPERCVILYEQSPKTTLETYGRFQEFAGDFAWAFDRLPEFGREMHQQQLEVQFREHTSYQKIMRRAGAPMRLVAAPYFTLPLNPNELLSRLWHAIGPVETYQYEVRILNLDGCLKSPASLQSAPL
ncbi:MAG: hypothetical protein IV100_31115 [Myxococcales bacterium]|nr:hypothetical protein [Myxococcales bacterium]